MILPLAPAHLMGLAAFLLSGLLLFLAPHWAAAPLLVFVATCLAAPMVPWLGFYLPIVSRGRKGAPGVALTFDDGPDPAVTPRVLDLLDRHGLKAAFFLIGRKAEAHPELVRDILARGHALGNHSHSHHPFLMLMGRRAIAREVGAAQAVLRRFGVAPLAFRPPVGVTCPDLERALTDQGMFCVNFNRRAGDLGNRRVAGLARRILGRARPRDIILLHDTAPHRATVDQLLAEFEQLIQGLARRGLPVQPLDALIGRPVMAAGEGRAGSGHAAPMRVLAVIPVYNHAATVRAVAEGVLAQGLPVLVVDDGSTDGGLDRLEGLPVQRCRLERNRGKGEAILRAARCAGEAYDAILTLDADGQHDPADAPALLEAARWAWPAIVIGARRMEAGRAPRSSRVGRSISNFWVRLECGQAVADTQSGFRLYPVPFLLSLRFFTRRFSFEAEALVRAAWAGLPLVTTPVSVSYGPERVSHFRKFRDNLRLTGLHTALVLRSLLPWPHRRLVDATGRPCPRRAELQSQPGAPGEFGDSRAGAGANLEPIHESAIEGATMTATVDSILAEARKRMRTSIETLKKEMATVRTGRANAGILDTLHVEYYGSMMPINQIAGVSVPEASMLLITPFDKKAIKAIETAILKSELGLNPANDGNVIRLPIPALNEERRRELTKVVGRMGEEIKTAVRNVRRDANEDVKRLEKDKKAPLSEDAAKKALDQVQKATDETIKEIEEIVKHKEAEIMHV